jgi:hypothetical protein
VEDDHPPALLQRVTSLFCPSTHPLQGCPIRTVDRSLLTDWERPPSSTSTGSSVRGAPEESSAPKWRVPFAQFEVDSNRSGQTWRVKLLQNGDKIFGGTRKTGGPSDTFTVRKVANDTSGTDSFKARALNASTGETCVGKASI